MTRTVFRLLPFSLWMLTGCFLGLGPRFPQNVQASFARDDMRQLTTRSLELYYPADHRAGALRIAARVEACVERLRRLTREPEGRERVRLFLTSADFNNAYVQPLLPGYPEVMVLPERVTLEVFNWYGLGSGEAAEIGCHEAVHYVQLQQVTGFWNVINLISGGALQPNVFTESWFLEGLATYYEGELGRRVGRPHSPLWRGWYEAIVSVDVDDVDPGYLSPQNRLLEPFGGNYLIGSHFVEWLAKTHGEQRLWELVHRQGDSVIPFVGVSLRFQRVYGKDIGSVFSDYVRHLRKTVVLRTRPATQKTLAPEIGYLARLATSRQGAIATITQGREEIVTLTVRERDGSVRFRRGLTLLLPFREYVQISPSLVSGMDFSADGRSLFLMAVDSDVEGSAVTRLLQFDTTNGALIRSRGEFVGLGGSLTPGGEAYVFIQVEGDTANLASLALDTGEVRRLTSFEGRNSLGPPAVSPDGKRIAFSRWSGEGFDLLLREEDGSLKALTSDGRFNYAPRWIDDERLLFTRQAGEAPHLGTQAFTITLPDGAPEQITDAPYTVLDPMPSHDGAVVFLNRGARDWSIDHAPIGPILASTRAESSPPSEAAADPSDEPPSIEIPLVRDEAADLEILADRPYSATDGLIVPRLRTLTEIVYDARGPRPIVTLGAALQGSDWLGFHNYVVIVDGSTSGQRGPGVLVQYINGQLAPWFLSASAARRPDGDLTTLSSSVNASRTFFTSPITFSLVGARLNVLEDGRGEVGISQFLGPSVSASYFAGEATSYGGLQRGLGFAGSAGVFPRGAGSSFDLGDLRVNASTALPLPLSRRHNLSLAVRGRYLPGAPAGLLRVGGFGNALAFSAPDIGQRRPLSPVALPGGISFTEPLRGYEDFVFRATRLAVGSASYRLRFIIDEGWASTFLVLPSFFIRQAELEGWGTMSYSDANVRTHGAAGVALFLRTVFGQSLPVSLYYQFAYRFHEGLPPLNTVGLSFD